MPENPYDEVLYTTRPGNETHPDRLAAVATLLGMNPAPVTRCRVLEIGCGDGSNLIPMAYALRGSTMLGVDLAEAPIAAGRRIVEDLGLENIRLVAKDLREIDASDGEFDYIIAHGIYSWVPREIRDALLSVCAARLAPEGVAFISYNTYPGRHVRQMLREMMLYHVRAAPAELRVEASRGFLKVLVESRMAPAGFRAALEEEADILIKKEPNALWHDDLAPVNEPVYFHQFAAHAAAHGLQYLGESDAHLMFDPRHALPEGMDDPLQREQYLDFLRLRRFRQTLLCREGVQLNRHPGPEAMRRFLFAAPAKLVESGEIEGLNGVRIAPGHPSLAQVAAAMGDSYPLPVPFDDLLPYASGSEELTELLLALVTSGFATFHVHDFPCEETVTERPRASGLARYQARNSQVVWSACHMGIRLDDIGRRLLLLLDGTRTKDEIAGELAKAPGMPEMDEIQRHLEESLLWMARMGLLA